MKRNKLWYCNQRHQLYPLLANENPFQHMKKIKLEANRITGASVQNLNEQNNHYILCHQDEHNMPQANLLRMDTLFPVKDNEQLYSLIKLYGLHTYQKLPDERLFLFRMLHLKALVWTRVDEQLNNIGKPFIIERSSADLITHHDELLSEIILRQAEVVAGRALYAAQLDIGSVLLAISGTGTIAVRQLYTLDEELAVQDELELKQALRLWQLNTARPQKAIDAKLNVIANHKNSIKQQYQTIKPPLILNKKIVNQNIQSSQINSSLKDDEAYTYERSFEPFLYDQDPVLWLGADPELIFVNEQDELIPAVEVLSDDPHGRYGIDSVISEQQLKFPVAEIRPDPQPSPQLLYQEIESIIDEMHFQAIDSQFKWLAGGMPKGIIPLGGHLHFSGVPLTSSLLLLLDVCLALPFSLVEDKSSVELRRPKYGALGDFRRQEHGGFEYRTLPSWLVSPQMTKAAIALGYIIVKEQAQIKQTLRFEQSLIEDYHKGNIVRVRAFSEYMFTVIEALPSYSEVEEWITPLKNMIKIGKRWTEGDDIRVQWKLPVYQ